ncbi:hypothetical protein LJR220_006596 [Bradyrhizobium sp. LjRoot220]|uniref:hypothetical protein n=1 Tax=Bradyrhizobium sp. LjRoot220 TaxID=3342284 RepID=UPI003ECD10A9
MTATTAATGAARGATESVGLLGIPTCSTTLIQQAAMQALQSRKDRTFLKANFGKARRAYIRRWNGRRLYCVGYAVVVDIDLEKFFDRVNHDI